MVLVDLDFLDNLQPTLLPLDIHLQDLGILQLLEATHLQVQLTHKVVLAILLLLVDILDSLHMEEVSYLLLLNLSIPHIQYIELKSNQNF